MQDNNNRWILAAQCPSRLGTVNVVTRFLKEQRCYITEQHSFDDRLSEGFFIRTELRPEAEGFNADAFEVGFAERAAEFAMRFELTPPGRRPTTSTTIWTRGRSSPREWSLSATPTTRKTWWPRGATSNA